jgi:hypothetical protein
MDAPTPDLVAVRPFSVVLNGQLRSLRAGQCLSFMHDPALYREAVAVAREKLTVANRSVTCPNCGTICAG